MATTKHRNWSTQPTVRPLWIKYLVSTTCMALLLRLTPLSMRMLHPIGMDYGLAINPFNSSGGASHLSYPDQSSWGRAPSSMYQFDVYSNYLPSRPALPIPGFVIDRTLCPGGPSRGKFSLTRQPTAYAERFLPASISCIDYGRCRRKFR